MSSERARWEIISVLQEMRAEIELADIRSSIKRERLETIDRRIERMRNLHEAEKEMLRKAREDAR